MTRERFEGLAEAYGGDVTRWPAAERDSAALLMASDSAHAQAVLARAGALDAALNAFAAPLVAPALRDRVLATAPGPRVARWPWLSPAALAAGLAAACAAGLVVGIVVSEGSSAGSNGGAEQVAASTLSLDPTFDLEGA